MPIYEFRCQECGYRFSKRAPWSEKASIRCPECGGEKLKEIFGLNFVSSGGSGACAGTAAGSGRACGGGFG